MTEKEPLGKKVITWPFLACLFVALIALYFIAKRFIFGIGAVSNMNDGYPWGIWIAFDVVVVTALACGGYAMALLVYVFNKGEYSPLVRPALMTSVFGYTLAGVSVLIDIGRYWQAYNIILPWYSNLHSVMFEVALCIGTYCLVLWMELTPAFLEKYEARRLQEKLNRIIFVFIALGILLPTMHQSSLGTMMLMAGYKLSPLWRTQFLPLLFLLTALLTGYAVVIMESYLSAVWFKRPFETNLLSKMANFIPWLLGIYPANRRSARGLFLSALFIVTGASFYRINTYITGFDPGTGWTYFPSVPEIMITLGLVAIEGMAYFWMVNRFPILPKAEHA